MTESEYDFSTLTATTRGLIEIRRRLMRNWSDDAVDLKVRLIILQLPEGERAQVQAEYQAYVETAGKITRADLEMKQLQAEASILGCTVAELQEYYARWDAMNDKEKEQALQDIDDRQMDYRIELMTRIGTVL